MVTNNNKRKKFEESFILGNSNLFEVFFLGINYCCPYAERKYCLCVKMISLIY